MTYSALMWTLAAMFLVGAITAVDIVRERRDGPVFISGTGPVTEEQVRQKLTADGLDERPDYSRRPLLRGHWSERAEEQPFQRRFADGPGA
jgi:hypothetical protein